MAMTVLIALKLVEIGVLGAMVWVFVYYLYPILKEVRALVVVIKGSMTVTDSQRSRIVEVAKEVKQEAVITRKEAQRAVAKAAEEVKQVIESVPDKVVEKINESASTDSGVLAPHRITPGPIKRPPLPPPADGGTDVDRPG